MPIARTGSAATWMLLTGLLALPCGGCADFVLLHPTVASMSASGASRRITDHGGRMIEVYVARSSGAASGEPSAFVLEFTGNATRAEEIATPVAERWGKHPVEVWVMNYPGYGTSAGPARLGSIPASALATYDELARVANGRPIFVAGSSLGTTAASYVASQRPVAGVMLQSPPPLQRMILQHFGWWNLWLLAMPVALQVPSDLNTLATTPHIHAPVVFILTGGDRLVPITYQRMVVEAHAGPKRVILRDGAVHNQPLSPEDRSRLSDAIDWLWSQAFEW